MLEAASARAAQKTFVHFTVVYIARTHVGLLLPIHTRI